MIGHSILENVSNKIQQNKIDARNMILLTVLATFDGIEYLDEYWHLWLNFGNFSYEHHSDFFLDILCMYRMNSVALLKIYSMRLGVLSE